jgi:hypothetical protein
MQRVLTLRTQGDAQRFPDKSRIRMPANQFPSIAFQLRIAPGLDELDKLADFNRGYRGCLPSIIAHRSCFKAVSPTTFLDFFPAAAKARIISTRFHERLQA